MDLRAWYCTSCSNQFCQNLKKNSFKFISFTISNSNHRLKKLGSCNSNSAACISVYIIFLTPHTFNSLQKLHHSPIQNTALWKSPRRHSLSTITSLITFASIQIYNILVLGVYFKFTNFVSQSNHFECWVGNERIALIGILEKTYWKKLHCGIWLYLNGQWQALASAMLQLHILLLMLV